MKWLKDYKQRQKDELEEIIAREKNNEKLVNKTPV